MNFDAVNRLEIPVALSIVNRRRASKPFRMLSNAGMCTVCNITNTIVENIKEWQQRPLEEVYFVVWMDGIVIKIRHSSRYVVWKERKQFIADLKLVYGAINKEAAYDTLQEFEKKWGSKYGYAIKS